MDPIVPLQYTRFPGVVDVKFHAPCVRKRAPPCFLAPRYIGPRTCATQAASVLCDSGCYMRQGLSVESFNWRPGG